MTKVTFVFPIIRNDLIMHALQSLYETMPLDRGDYKVIVVDQTIWKPNDGFYEGLWGMCDLYIKPHVNYGFAQGANLGARLAVSEYVTIANDDVVFLPGWWEGIMETFEKYDNALCVAPMSPLEPGWGWGEEGYRLHTGEETIHRVPHDDDRLVEVLWKLRMQPEWILELRKQWDNAMVDGIAMWLVTFKREEWLRDVGLFDERFMKGGGEDYDMCSRIYQAGYRAMATSWSWVWHWWGMSKDMPNGREMALPPARPDWNKLSTKGFGDEGLWDPDCDVWGRTGERTDEEIWRAPL